MSRIFRRPMFRKGGNVGEGIMTGIVDRENHATDPFVGDIDPFNVPYSFDSPQTPVTSPYKGRTIPSLRELTTESREALMEAAGDRGGFDPLTSFLLAYGPAAAVENRGGGTIGNLIAAAEKPAAALIKEKAEEDKFQRGLRLEATSVSMAKRNQMIAEEADRKFKSDMAMAKEKLNRDLSVEEKKFLINKSIREAEQASERQDKQIQAQKDIAAADNQNRLDIEAARKKDVNSIESRIDAETAELLKTVSTEYEARNRATWALQTSGDLMRKGYAVSDELLEESQVVDTDKFKKKAKTLIKKAGNEGKIFYYPKGDKYYRLVKVDGKGVFKPFNKDGNEIIEDEIKIDEDLKKVLEEDKKIEPFGKAEYEQSIEEGTDYVTKDVDMQNVDTSNIRSTPLSPNKSAYENYLSNYRIGKRSLYR